jgi:ribonuclease HII
MTNPTFDFEREYWEQGISLIAGLDEAGMGALAGPVVASAVVFNCRSDQTQNEKRKTKNYGVLLAQDNICIRDSKTLSAKQREKAETWIKENALAWAVGEASVDEITELNIRGAAHLAMRRAVEQLYCSPDLLLIDGNPVQIHNSIPSVSIVGGDGLSFSIAAASILAKVHRDRILTALDKEYPVYGFAGHKGYGSAGHMDALRKHGPCKWHRPTYRPVRILREVSMTNTEYRKNHQ